MLSFFFPNPFLFRVIFKHFGFSFRFVFQAVRFRCRTSPPLVLSNFLLSFFRLRAVRAAVLRWYLKHRRVPVGFQLSGQRAPRRTTALTAPMTRSLRQHPARTRRRREPMKEKCGLRNVLCTPRRRLTVHVLVVYARGRQNCRNHRFHFSSNVLGGKIAWRRVAHRFFFAEVRRSCGRRAKRRGRTWNGLRTGCDTSYSVR